LLKESGAFITKNKPTTCCNKMESNYHRAHFFDKGLRFECKQCGACCTGEPGIIYIGRGEVKQVAKHLSIQVSELIEMYLYPFMNGYSVREHSDGRCFFYNDGCNIYAVRPKQCKTFPFWFENLRSHRKWLHISQECPGIGQGLLYSKEQVLEIVQSNIDAIIKRHIAEG
jgi:Fe-S-cluster containining protein